MRSVLGILFVLIGCAVWGATSYAAQPELGKLAERAPALGQVVVAERAAVADERITLGDIATLTGFDDTERKRLSEIEVARAPRPGQTRDLNERFLRRFLAARAPKAALVLPAKVTITRDATRLSEADLRERLLQAAAKQAGVAPERVAVGRLNQARDWLLPAGDSTLTVSFPTGTRFAGLATARLSVDTPRGHYADYYVGAEITIKTQALRIRHAVPRGTRLSERDLVQTEADSSELPAGALTTMEEALGQEAAGPLVPGTFLLANQVLAPVLIKRGAPIRLVIEMPGMRIEARGLAQEPGRLRSTIKAINLASGKAVYGTVVDAEEIHVIH